MPDSTRQSPAPGDPPPQKSGSYRGKAAPKAGSSGKSAGQQAVKASGRKAGKAGAAKAGKSSGRKSARPEPPPQKSGSYRGKASRSKSK